MPRGAIPLRPVTACSERLEPRRLLSTNSAVPAPTAKSSPPPTVIGAYISGSDWTPAFRHALQNDYNSAEYGAWVGPATGTAELPWVNVNRITLRLSSGDMLVESRHLRVFGSNVAEYPVASFEFHVETVNYTGVATWTLAHPLAADKLLLLLDAHSADGVRTRSGVLLDGDGDGSAGGDFRLAVNSLPGDFGGVLTVEPTHVLAMRAYLGAGANQGDVARYSPLRDVNADGSINVQDLAEVRRRIGTSLPPYGPPGTASALSSASRPRPAARTLFGSEPILA